MPQSLTASSLKPLKTGESENQLCLFARLLRVKQWVKNLFLFAGIIFSGHLAEPAQLIKVIIGFVSFCMIASALYIFNDWTDIEKDRLHPTKRYRPLASKMINPSTALCVMAALSLAGLAIAYFLGAFFCILALVYIGITISYSLYLKQIPIIDVMAIAAGFLLRTVAGVAVIKVRISPWLLVCAGLLALFLALIKRRQELLINSADSTREVLEQYSTHFLDQAITIVTAATLTSYFLYAFAVHSQWMMITIPFVLFGVFRYLLLSELPGKGEEPEQIFLSDWPFMINLFLWVASGVIIIYLR